MRGHKERGWTDLAKACAVVVALLCVPFAVAAFDTGVLPGPAGGAAFTATGGTVTQPVVFTGDNSGGTGTVRIRPSDEDTQLVLCEASNNASPEVCSALQHYNGSATVSGSYLSANGYVDSSGVQQRYNTGFGIGQLNFSSSSTAANNFAVFNVYGTGGAVAGNAGLAVSGAATSTFITGTLGTVTNDFRGPILNGGSATCDGLSAGSVCISDAAGLTVASTGTASINVGFGANTAAGQIVVYNESDVALGGFGCLGSALADVDTQDTCYMAGIGKVINIARTDDVAAGSVHTKWIDNYSASGVLLMDLLGNGTVRPLLYGSQSNCSDGAGAAACSAAPAGSVVIDAGATTVVVSTTAVTANSQIFVQDDSSLGTKLGVTCNTAAFRDYRVSARTAATSFTITASAAPVTNPACLSYSIIN